jgi:alpha-beta hydrolase superfamily lysophospholipase
MISKKRFWKWAGVIILIYLGAGITLFFLQEKILFHPVVLSPDYKYEFSVPFKEINLAVNDKKNLSIIQFTVPDSICKGVVLYFHGNVQNINHYAACVANFTKNGYEVWMLDYPGFGKSTGERTEQIMYDDALRIYKMARARFSPDSIIVYGRSIGTGVACQLASVRDCRRLILETPYYSADALAKHYFFMYPVIPLTKYSFPSYSYFEKITAPVTIFHGTNDEVIPYSQSKRLMKRIRSGGELITIEKGKHNNLNTFRLFHQKLDSVLAL